MLELHQIVDLSVPSIQSARQTKPVTSSSALIRVPERVASTPNVKSLITIRFVAVQLGWRVILSYNAAQSNSKYRWNKHPSDETLVNHHLADCTQNVDAMAIHRLAHAYPLILGHHPIADLNVW